MIMIIKQRENTNCIKGETEAQHIYTNIRLIMCFYGKKSEENETFPKR